MFAFEFCELNVVRAVGATAQFQEYLTIYA